MDVNSTLIQVKPRDGDLIRDEDIIEAIRQHGAETALVMFSGVHYLTGQVFDLEAIAKAAHEAGCLVGFDLAHVVGNVPIKLSEWNADFAVWCTYKYLNAGPGSTAGLFVNRRHHAAIAAGEIPILAGWWGVDLKKRFLMKHVFEPYQGARAFQQSCTSVFNSCGLLASLEIFQKTTIAAILERSRKLTDYFRVQCKQTGLDQKIQIITPLAAGAQLSIALESREVTIEVFKKLGQLKIVTDRREPNIIRLTFTGLYNSFEDVSRVIQALQIALNEQ